MTRLTTTPILLEQSRDIVIRGCHATVIRLHAMPQAWCDRATLYKVQRRRERELAEIKRDCRRLRGLLRDLD